MRTFALITILLIGNLPGKDIQPDSPDVPLLQVFELIQTQPDTYDSGPSGRPTHHWKVDDKHPLLVVHSLSDFLLEADKKAVRIVLNKSDAAVFTQIIQKYKIVGVTAGDTGTVIMPSAPPYDSLTFDDPVADYLRHRFHIKPHSNDVDRS